MKRNFYIFSNGRLKRKDNTLFFINEEQKKKALPVETIRNLYIFGEIDFNSKFLNFVSQNQFQIHIFNYYGFYSGSFIPRKSLLSGEVIVKQVKAFTRKNRQIPIAKELILAASFNILKNLNYYKNRGRNLTDYVESIKKLRSLIQNYNTIEEIMGGEGQIRQIYYAAFTEIIQTDIEFAGRIKRPPNNMINTLISFGNSLLYTTTLSEIFHTQLNPTISFLHKPSYRRYSLALDVSEIFKPILVDRIIFRLLNRSMISEGDFHKELNCCYMKEKARKIFLKEYDSQLQRTIKHRKLKRQYSYRYLIRLECYKLIKTIMAKQKYEAFKIWW